jgi:hypothetical protein
MDLPPSIGARGARTCRGHEGVVPTDGMFAARCMIGNSARPGGSLGEMLHQLREQAEGGRVQVFVAGARGRNWHFSDLDRCPT